MDCDPDDADRLREDPGRPATGFDWSPRAVRGGDGRSVPGDRAGARPRPPPGPGKPGRPADTLTVTSIAAVVAAACARIAAAAASAFRFRLPLLSRTCARPTSSAS